MNIRDISAAALKEAMDGARRGGGFKLNVPENARVNKRNPRQRFWTEYGSIASLKRYEKPGKSGLTHTVYEIKLQITAEGSGENIGTTFTVFPRVAYDALPLDPSHGDRIMSIRSIGLLTQFFEATGIENGMAAETIQQVFTEMGSDSPLVGQMVSFEVKQEEPETKGDRTNVDVVTFMEA